MLVVQVNNSHRILGGSDIVAAKTTELLKNNGLKVISIIRDSYKKSLNINGRIQAFYSGIYSRSAANEMLNVIKKYRPDIVHAHEIYPFISPWIFKICKKNNIPVVLSCHDYRLICPTAHMIRNNHVCQKCANKKEYWCFIYNCRNKYLESAAYFSRMIVARKARLFINNVDVFLSPSEFLKNILIEKAEINKNRIIVLPNMVEVPLEPVEPSKGEYFLYIGRISEEKGLNILNKAAEKSGLPVWVIGNKGISNRKSKFNFNNLKEIGFLNQKEYPTIMKKVRALILPSICNENSPLSIIEAMSYGVPVIASRIGGIPEIVEDGKTGLLFEAGNSDELSEKMKTLYYDNELTADYGKNARSRILSKYNIDNYYIKLYDIYKYAKDTFRNNYKEK